MNQAIVFFTPGDLYDRYQITSSTLERWIKSKGFPHAFKVGQTRRFNIKHVESWEQQQQAA
jgi:predicted DNA-binding transcriptional regulator AlpA